MLSYSRREVFIILRANSLLEIEKTFSLDLKSINNQLKEKKQVCLADYLLTYRESIDLGISEKKAEIKTLIRERLFQLIKTLENEKTFSPLKTELVSKPCK
jgi:hypothetical protein